MHPRQPQRVFETLFFNPVLSKTSCAKLFSEVCLHPIPVWKRLFRQKMHPPRATGFGMRLLATVFFPLRASAGRSEGRFGHFVAVHLRANESSASLCFVSYLVFCVFFRVQSNYDRHYMCSFVTKLRPPVPPFEAFLDWLWTPEEFLGQSRDVAKQLFPFTKQQVHR